MKKNTFKLSLNNYRIFDKRHNFEITPITLLTGPNSSGKSTLAKIVFLLANNIKDDFFPLKLNFDNEDKKFVKQLGKLKNAFNESEIIIPIMLHEKKFKLAFQYSKENDSIRLTKLDFRYKNETIIGYRINKYNYFIYKVDYGFIRNMTSEIEGIGKHQSFFEYEDKETQKKEKQILNEPYFTSENHEPESTHDIDLFDIYSILNDFFGLEDYIEVYLNYKTKDKIIAPTNLLKKARELWNTEKLKQAFNNSIRKIKTENLFAVPVLKHDMRSNFFINEDSSTFLELALSSFIKINSKTKDYTPYLNKWVNIFGIGKEIIISKVNEDIAKIEVIKHDDKKLNLSELGYGVSQIISILLSPFLIFKSNDTKYGHTFVEDNKGDIHIGIEEKSDRPFSAILYLEEPECNLHPNWQSLLMELIYEVQKKFDISFIIETHSEYMIRKTQSIVGSDKKAKEDFKIYYFRGDKEYYEDNNKEKKRCYEIEIREDGMLKNDFGKGFLDESSNLAFQLFRTQQQN